MQTAFLIVSALFVVFSIGMGMGYHYGVQAEKEEYKCKPKSPRQRGQSGTSPDSSRSMAPRKSPRKPRR